MEKHAVKKLVFSSSATVYRWTFRCRSTKAPAGFHQPLWMDEVYVRADPSDVVGAHPDWSVVLLRYFNPIGAHESGLIGEDPSGIPNNLMPYITQTALGSARRSTSSETTTRRTTEPASATTSTSSTSRSGTSRRSRYAEKNAGCEAFNLGTGQGYMRARHRPGVRAL